MSTPILRRALLALAAALFVVVSAPHAADKAERKDLIATAAAAGKFKTLLTALDAAGLTDALKGKGPFTVFAPTDAAFAKIDKKDLAELLNDKDALAAVLKYHVVSGDVMADDVVKLDGKGAMTLDGKEVMVMVKGNTVMVNDAKVVKADVVCSNGVIHVIDTVLMPPK